MPSSVVGGSLLSRKFKLLILGGLRRLGVFALFRRFCVRPTTILAYHAGAYGDEWTYNPKLFMRKATFRARLDWLQSHGYQFVSLDELCSSNALGNTRRAVALTFDDGWVSTHTELLSTVREKRLPSVLYLSTKLFVAGLPIVEVALRYIASKRTFHVVDLQDLPQPVSGSYDFGRQDQFTSLIHNVHAWMENVSPNAEQVCQLLDTVAERSGLGVAALAVRTRRFSYVQPAELHAAALGGCRIESHGHVHHYPFASQSGFAADLAECTRVIRGLGLPAPRHYCYPSGSHDTAAARVLKDAGMLSATTCLPGSVRKVGDENRYYLPRFLDGEDVDLLEFEAELSGFMPLIRSLWQRRTL